MRCQLRDIDKGLLQTCVLSHSTALLSSRKLTFSGPTVQHMVTCQSRVKNFYMKNQLVQYLQLTMSCTIGLSCKFSLRNSSLNSWLPERHWTLPFATLEKKLARITKIQLIRENFSILNYFSHQMSGIVIDTISIYATPSPQKKEKNNRKMQNLFFFGFERVLFSYWRPILNKNERFRLTFKVVDNLAKKF